MKRLAAFTVVTAMAALTLFGPVGPVVAQELDPASQPAADGVAASYLELPEVQQAQEEAEPGEVVVFVVGQDGELERTSRTDTVEVEAEAAADAEAASVCVAVAFSPTYPLPDVAYKGEATCSNTVSYLRLRICGEYKRTNESWRPHGDCESTARIFVASVLVSFLRDCNGAGRYRTYADIRADFATATDSDSDYSPSSRNSRC